MSEIFETTNDVDQFKTIGQVLKEARERAHLTVTELSKKTKIGVTMLEFLEADELTQLPNRAYVCGYIKSCSKELGLDQNKTLDILELTYRAHGMQAPQKKHTPTSAPVRPTAKPAAKEKRTQHKFNFSFAFNVKSVSAALLALVLVLGYTFYRQAHNTTETTAVEQVDEQVKPETISETTPLLDDTPVAQATAPIPAPTKEVVKEIVKEAPKVAPVAETKKEPTKKSKYETNAPVTLRPIHQKLFSIKETSAEALALIPANYQQAVVQGKQNIYILAKTDSSWLTYKKDQEDIKALKLKKGEALFLSGDEFRLFFGNINSTEVYLNNQLLDTPSTSGVKSLVFPETSNSKFKMPLFVYLKDGRIITSDEYEASLKE